MNQTLPELAAGSVLCGLSHVTCQYARHDLPGAERWQSSTTHSAQSPNAGAAGQRDPGQFVPCTVAAPVRACVAEGGNTLWPPPPLLDGNPTTARAHAVFVVGRGRRLVGLLSPAATKWGREKCIGKRRKAGEKTLDRGSLVGENEGLVVV
jgi:hypothetical protein